MLQAQRLAVNVVTWNSLPYLPGLFASLEDQTTRDFSVTVIDNASTDGTISWIEQNALGTAMLRNFKNQGFSRAHNQGISLMLSRWAEADWDARYILVCNPDIEFSPACLEQLLAYMDAHPEVGIAGPKLLRAMTVAEGEDGERKTQRTNTLDSTGIVMYKTRRHADRGAGEEDAAQYDQASDVFGVSGACLLLRASVLAKLKQGDEWFDEDFFAYKEDVDLAWRAKRFGIQARFVPEAVAWHHRRAASGVQGFLWLKAFVNRFKKPAHINFYSTRNQLWLVWKNDEFMNRLAHFPWLGLYGFGKVCVGVWSGATWRAWLQAWAGFGKMQKKRTQDEPRVICRGKEMRRWFV